MASIKDLGKKSPFCTRCIRFLSPEQVKRHSHHKAAIIWRKKK